LFLHVEEEQPEGRYKAEKEERGTSHMCRKKGDIYTIFIPKCQQFKMSLKRLKKA
jgi:hypothetical protein